MKQKHCLYLIRKRVVYRIITLKDINECLLNAKLCQKRCIKYVHIA